MAKQRERVYPAPSAVSPYPEDVETQEEELNELPPPVGAVPRLSPLALYEAIATSAEELRASLAGYSAIKRILDNRGNPGGPLFSWTGSIGNEPVEVITDTAELNSDEREAALQPIADLLARKMLAAATHLQLRAGEFAEIAAESIRPGCAIKDVEADTGPL